MEWKFNTMLAEEQKKKTRKRPKYEEDRLESNCVRWFDIQYPKRSILLHHSPNEGKRSLLEGARNRTLGTRKGFPDLIFLQSGGEGRKYSFLAIELKTEAGRLTEEQKTFRYACETLSDGLYVVIRSLEDFRKCVSAYIRMEDMEIWKTLR